MRIEFRENRNGCHEIHAPPPLDDLRERFLVHMFLTADLEITNVPFPRKVSSNRDVHTAWCQVALTSKKYWLISNGINI